MPANTTQDADDAQPPRGVDRTTVLLADDDDAFRESLVLWLAADERWDVREATDGEEALAKLDGAVDILVLDRRMPILSGPEVVDRLDETGFEGSVIVLSAFEPDGHLDENDTTMYLTKPVDRETFVDALTRRR
ncbi:response regulator receiver domain-containing protein [Haloplanus aerogenes]|nr:response regulator receiver domain-containing protein [Haloplanus aerogenes]